MHWMAMNPLLKFEKYEIPIIARRYQYQFSETELIDMKDQVSHRGYLTKGQLIKIAFWKAPRSSKHAIKNSEEYVSEITRLAFKSQNERVRIEVLNLLDGVSWPTASVILHLFHTDPYPIIDFRALWSVSLEVPKQYTFDFWWTYVNFCRLLANKTGVDMRTLDRALWQYSKENQTTKIQ
ncbi:hypothetical protein [Desulfotignum phosphitoxidans]|nr:hypothetical protein [Desulfotignum phosphitoxidans]